MQNFDTLTEAIDNLFAKGYELKFEFHTDFIVHPNGRSIPIEKIGIDWINKITSIIDPGFKCFVYAIITEDKDKGYFIRNQKSET